MKKWKAILKDGTPVEENTQKANWTPELAQTITHLELDNNGQIIKLPPNMKEYVQGKTASGDLISGKCQIESRFLGFKIGSNIVRIRVNEQTNNITVEIN